MVRYNSLLSPPPPNCPNLGHPHTPEAQLRSCPQFFSPLNASPSLYRNFSPSHRVSNGSDKRQIFRGCSWRGISFFLSSLWYTALFFRIVHIILDAVNHLSAADPRAAHLISGSNWAPLSVSESLAWSVHTFWLADVGIQAFHSTRQSGCRVGCGAPQD
ncbi:hypothetical protein DFH08DRAFT_891110 [Mycena albidolilacea]|uniref:Uncharacterized protein n=1 Tax=Mycena albidolilacea TaxID=1033008 RepID=A0AAD6ZEX2_9AGAR|nr:hypothetical protein DFH08DRAFT_891110 [Mycena albidolilacea]